MVTPKNLTITEIYPHATNTAKFGIACYCVSYDLQAICCQSSMIMAAPALKTAVPFHK